MYRALYSRILSLQPKLSARFCSKTVPYYYEMPECYQQSYYLANASLHDNINWFYYRGIEVAFNKYIEKFKCMSPSSKQEDVVINVLNKINIMEYCNYVLEMKFPLTKDSGKIEIVTAYSAKHGIHYPRHLGGLRINENVGKSQMKAFAALGSFKNICADVPFAGSYTGIKINPLEYSQSELTRLITTFTKAITEINFIGPKINILEPDLNCSEYLIDTIARQFVEIKGVSNYDNVQDFPCIIGKPITSGGLKNYDESKADGIFYGADKFVNNDLISYSLKLETGWKDKTYIIKSLDLIGIQLVKHLTKHGAKCVGVSDSDCSYYNENGINIEEAIKHKLSYGSCKNYFPLYNEKKLMKEKCDILIITDSFHKIDYLTAPDIEAKIIIEAACCAITPNAHKILITKEKLVIPDVYINSGASVASYVEFIRNINPKGAEKRDTSRNLMFAQNMPYLSQDRTTSVIQYDADLETDSTKDDFLTHAIEFRMGASAQKILKILREYNLNLDIRTATYIMTSEKIFNLLQHERLL